MDVRIILGLSSVAAGIFTVIAAYFYIKRKQNIFAHPPSLYRVIFARKIQSIENFGRTALDLSDINKKTIVELTVRLHRYFAYGMFAIGGILMAYPWSLTASIVIFSTGLLSMMTYLIIAFVAKIIALSKNC